MDLGKEILQIEDVLCVYGNLKSVKIFSPLILYVNIYLKCLVSSPIGRWSYVIVFVNDILSIDI